MRGLAIALFSLIIFGCAGVPMVDLSAKTSQLKDLQDFDQDGVVETREKCADTYVGAAIDNDGCSRVKRIEDSIKLEVNFDNDSSIVHSIDYEKIKQVADFMTTFPGSHVTIEGHCSRIGSAKYNQNLSEKRASAVAKILTNRFDIAPFRVSAVGYGFDKPIDSSDSEDAHNVNRRIMATLSGTEQSTDMKWTIYTVDEEQE